MKCTKYTYEHTLNSAVDVVAKQAFSMRWPEK